MSLKDQLTAKLGDRMRASMGAGDVTPPADGPPGTTPRAPSKNDGLKAFRAAALIPLDRLAPDPDQPRKTFSDEEIDRLADSLRARGMLQPIRARYDVDLERWVIVAGERRFRAARRAGWTEVPCVTVEAPLTPSEIRMDQLLENCMRVDLAPMEQAAAFKELLDANGWSARRLAEELHLSHQTVIRSLGLLELPPEVRERVERGELAPRTASEIASLDSPEEQVAVADQAVAGKLTRDEVAATVRQRAASKTKGQGRGGKARKVTSRTLRTSAGYKITAECRRGIEPQEFAAALREAADQVETKEETQAA